MMRNVEQTEVYTVVEDTEEEKVALLAGKNEEKRKLQMDPIIKIGQSKDYSAFVEETNIIGG